MAVAFSLQAKILYRKSISKRFFKGQFWNLHSNDLSIYLVAPRYFRKLFLGIRLTYLNRRHEMNGWISSTELFWQNLCSIKENYWISNQFSPYIYLESEFRKQQQTNEIGAENECKNYSWHFCAFSVISSDTSHREVGLIRRPNLWYLGARWFWLSPLPKAPGRCCLLHSVANYIKLV